MVRAKFKCVSIDDGTVTMEAVVDDSPENKEFFDATPFGYAKMGIVNEAALQQFVPGQEYYLDFSPAKTE